MFLSRAEIVRIVSVAGVWSAAMKQAPAALINEVLSPSWDEMKSLYLATLSTLVLRLCHELLVSSEDHCGRDPILCQPEVQNSMSLQDCKNCCRMLSLDD